MKTVTDNAHSMPDIFKTAFVRNCLELVALGHSQLARGELSTLEETEITGILCDAMEAVLDSEAPPPWATTVTVVDDQPESVRGKTGKHRPRTDVCVRCINPRPAQRFHFEAKRLFNGASVGLYLGTDGMMSLVTGYYGDTPCAGMIGYVQAESCSTWTRKIQDRIRATPSTYHVPEPVNFETFVLAAAEPVFCSEHVRCGEDRRKQIHHVLLTCAL